MSATAFGSTGAGGGWGTCDVTHTEYDVQGRVTNTWGATYPVAYAYDGFGRMSEMHTWRQEGGTPDVTRWLYDEATGLLEGSGDVS